MEFRTEPPGTSKDESGTSDTLEKWINKYLEGLEKDPRSQMALLQQAQQNGIPPALIAPLVDIDTEQIAKLQQQMAQEQQTSNTGGNQPDMSGHPNPQVANENNENMDKQTPQGEELSEEKIIGVLDSIMDFHDPDMTLQELKDWVEDNPDLVENAIAIL